MKPASALRIFIGNIYSDNRESIAPGNDADKDELNDITDILDKNYTEQQVPIILHKELFVPIVFS